MEGRQIEEAMLAVLHTILLHRSTGKFHYKKEGTYSIGTVGTQDVDCDFIDFTYVRVSSEELDRALKKAVGEFKVKRSMSVTLFLIISYLLVFLGLGLPAGLEGEKMSCQFNRDLTCRNGHLVVSNSLLNLLKRQDIVLHT